MDGNKKTHEGSPKNIPDLEVPFPTFLLIKETKIPIGLTIDVSKFTTEFMLHMDLAFFNVERIRGFTSNFLAISSAT